MEKIFNTIRSEYAVKILFLSHIFVAFLLCYLLNPWIHGDSRDYLLLADSLSQGYFGVTTIDGFQLEGLRLPAYPLIVFFYQSLFGKNFLGLIIIQAVLYLLSVFLIWRMLDKFFKPAVGLIFLAILLPYPFIAYTSCLILTEAWCLFLLTAMVFLLVNYQNSRFETVATIGASLLLGISFYFRPNLFPLSVAIFLAILVINRRNWKNAILFIALTWTIIFPYAIYNYIKFDKFTTIPVASNVGLSLLQATWQNSISVESFTAFASNNIVNQEIVSSGMNEQFQKVYSQTEKAMIDAKYSPLHKKIQYQILLNKFASEIAYENIKNYPVNYLSSSFKNMFRMWFATYNQSFESEKLKIAGFDLMRFIIMLPGIIMLLFGIIGCLYGTLKKISPKARGFSILATAGLLDFTLTMCWLHTESRYTTPVRLFLVASAAIGCYYLFRSVREKFGFSNPVTIES